MQIRRNQTCAFYLSTKTTIAGGRNIASQCEIRSWCVKFSSTASGWILFHYFLTTVIQSFSNNNQMSLMLHTFLENNREHIQEMLSYDKNSKEYKRKFEILRALAGRFAIQDIKSLCEGDEDYSYKRMYYRYFVILCLLINLCFLALLSKIISS